MITKKLQSVKELWIQGPVLVPREKEYLELEQICALVDELVDSILLIR